jgi:hypothetical protein
MSQPNILLIMTDEHAPMYSGTYGHPLVHSNWHTANAKKSSKKVPSSAIASSFFAMAVFLDLSNDLSGTIMTAPVVHIKPTLYCFH